MTPRSGPAWYLRVAWILVLSTHLALGVLALWLLPHGFPLAHPRFVLGTLAPACLAAASLALSVTWVLAPRAAARFMPMLPAFWGSVAVGLLLVFPETGAPAARLLFLFALCLALLAGFSCRGSRARHWLPPAFFGVAAGQLVARCERPGAPGSQPSRETPPHLADAPGERVPLRLEMAPDLVAEGAALRVTWQGRRASISIAPALEFDRTPADGFWSIFTDDRGRSPNIAFASTAVDRLRLWTSDGTQLLQVQREGYTLGSATRVVRLDAWTVLQRPVYSHLNTFTTVQLSGHRRLGLRFSPCASALIEVKYADYPTGAPARFAYVDARRRFRVAQAADAEKGPFTTLAEGDLAPTATLEIELVDLDDSARPFARLELLDFAAELSTALSPTAGYGVTENAIEFGLAQPASSSSAHILFTLAASGVGRGWDSVGHAAGTYRNRVILRSLEAVAPP